LWVLCVEKNKLFPLLSLWLPKPLRTEEKLLTKIVQ
jgi:hypothetical protein